MSLVKPQLWYFLGAPNVTKSLSVLGPTSKTLKALKILPAGWRVDDLVAWLAGGLPNLLAASSFLCTNGAEPQMAV